MNRPNDNLAALRAAGQSVWLDSMRRSFLTDGTLERYRDDYALGGVTTNPAIFGEALRSDEYDAQIEQLAREGLDARTIYRRVAQQDVQGACDVFRPVFSASGGADGFVSLEVDPDLADDTDRTLTQAKEYWEAVDRPNLMVKIPATDAGMPAIQAALTAGINVNVTLLFGIEAYRQVMEAYLAALEAREEQGHHLQVQSVASFFVSRADSEVDERLDAAGRGDLKGTAGIANARAAYAEHIEVFGSERFARLAARGASVQRPLWASTGVKDPSFSATKYVEALIAAGTVNTMPLATIEAAAESLSIEVASAAADPSSDLAALADAGIDMADVTKVLLEEGIAKFAAPMDELLATIERKSKAAVGHV